LTDAVEVHAVAAHVHQEARRVIQVLVSTLLDLLVNESDAREKKE
jgi:hypothetical protein